MTTPNWAATFNGTLNDGGTRAQSAQVNQFLGVHAYNAIYPGTAVVSPFGSGVSGWALQMSTLDVDQPFPMSGTSIGRVQIPLLPVGNGADLLVSLCADSSGSPGSVLQQTRIPKEWIYQLSNVAAASTPSSVAPTPLVTGNPLAVAQFNTLMLGPEVVFNYPIPSIAGANIINSNWVANGDYIIALGGVNANTNATVATVFTAFCTGVNTSVAAANMVPQPSMPQNNGGNAYVAATSDTVMIAGGYTTASGPPVSTVFTASWDSSTGTVGSWSAQPSLPVALSSGAAASYGETVYVICGNNTSGVSVNTVYYATIVNGQISAWNTGPSYPFAINTFFAGVIGNYLIVAGGQTSAVQQPQGFYAALAPDGSFVDGWTTLPPLSSSAAPGGPLTVCAQGLITQNTSNTAPGAYLLTFTENGPSNYWFQQNDLAIVSGSNLYNVVPSNGANYEYMGVDLSFGHVDQTTLYPTPYISVPLPTTGLTNGATYHLLMQQQGGDAGNHLRTHVDLDVFTGNPTALTSPRDSYTWTAQTSGYAVPFTVFSNTVSAGGAPPLPLHTWEDNGNRISTLVTATTPDGRLLGVCDAVNKGKALNQNPGFESVLYPWFGSGGTAVRSNTQTYDSGWSAQVTPSGSAANVFLGSENLQCLPGQSITVQGRMWFTNAVTGNASMSLNWYDQHGTYLSTSSNNISVAATTWQGFNNTFTAPSGAYQFAIAATLSGTPAASNVFYVDDCFAFYTYAGEQFASVAEVTWAGSWPSKVYPPTGITQLA